MKRLCLFLFAVCVLPIFAAAQSVDQVEAARVQALQKGDHKALEELLAPQFVTTRPDGSVLGNDEYLQKLQTGKLKFQNLQHSDVNVHRVEDTAVITGLSTAQLHDEAGERRVTVRYTHTYVRAGGRWLLLAMHTSQVTASARQ